MPDALRRRPRLALRRLLVKATAVAGNTVTAAGRDEPSWSPATY
jgi:hypothetical protein